MVRRVAVVAVVLLAGCVAATVHAEPAAAYYDAITTADDWTIVDGWLSDDAASELIDDAAKRTRWGRIRAGLAGYGIGGLSGSAGLTLPTLAVTAGGLAFGWQIGHSSGLASWARGKLLGLGDPSPTGAITGGNWSNYGCTTGVNDYTPCQDMGLTLPNSAWILSKTGTNPCATNVATTNWTFSWGIDFNCSEANNAQLLTWLQTVAASAPGSTVVTGDCTSNAGTGDCYGVFMSWGAMMGQATFSELRPYNSTTDSPFVTWSPTNVPRPTGYAYGSAGATDAEAQLENDPILGPAIGTILHPFTDTGGDSSETVALPQPRLGETYSQYRTRLRALGFLGTIVLDPLDSLDALPEFGPNVVTRVSVTTTTGTELYPMLDPWPEPPPTLTVPGPTTTVTIQHNPEDAPAPNPGDPGSPADPPPGTAPPPGGGGTITVGDCSCPGPDFSPFTSTEYGDKFPFGIVEMVDGLLGTTLYASPDAPSWDFDFSSFSAAGFGPYDLGHYEVDLEVLDAYAGMLRTIISWAIWIGGLWWFGSRWFGFKGSGDPGEVVDEAWS